MSCVIGLVTDEGILFASDTAASDGNIIIPKQDDKLIKRFTDVEGPTGVRIDIGFGVVGSMKMNTALQYHLAIPPISEDEPVNKYVHTKLVPAMGVAFECARLTVNGCTSDSSNNLALLGIGGKLYMIGDDLDIVSCGLGYDAIGSGREIALGSLFTSKHLETGNSLYRARTAVEAAASLTAFVSMPMKSMTILKSPYYVGVKNENKKDSNL